MAIFSSKRSLVLGFSILLLSSCESSSSSEGGEVNVIAADSGEKLYLQNCSQCHGKKGDLGVSGASDLTQSQKTLEEKIQFIQEGSSNGIMQPYGEKFGGPLTDEQIKKIASFVENLGH